MAMFRVCWTCSSHSKQFHHVLVAAACVKGFNLVLLKLSLAAYRSSRSIGIDGAFSRCVRATRGITAGSGFATSELRLLLLDTMQAIQERWGASIVVKLYVDDLTLAACGLPQLIINLIVRVVDFVIE